MKRFKNILYVESGETDQTCAVARALESARANQARLSVLSVVQPVTAAPMLQVMGLSAETLQKALIEESTRRLQQLIGAADANCSIEVDVVAGTLFLEVIRDVLRHGRDLVIKCAETTGMAGRLFGSDDLHLLRKCPCPVWLCKPSTGRRYGRILVTVDIEQFYPQGEVQTRHELNVRLLELAASMAIAEGAELHVAYAWSAIGEGVLRSTSLWAAEEKIDAYLVAERERHGRALESLLAEVRNTLFKRGEPMPEPFRHLPKGSARSELPALARRIDADLVVLGTLGRTGVPGLLIGNTAEAVLHQVECSVLALKPAGFVSPVTC
jgi:nucleotide-binding universal stress UspA family protein